MKQRQDKLTEIDQTLKLLRPVPILIEDYGDEIHASFSEIQAYGAGLTEAEAITDLKSEIRNIYFELKDVDDSKLGKLPLHWKETLLKLVRDKGTAQNSRAGATLKVTK